MRMLTELLHESIADALAESDSPDEINVEEITQDVLRNILPAVQKELDNSLRKRAPSMLRERRGIDRGFRRRNLRRWKPAFDLMEMIWVISEEVGAEFDNDARPTAAAENDFQFGALAELHARALLVTREIICLLEGGFADGALARWRSLHEIAVVSMFLNHGDQELAYRYLASFRFNALRAARQYNHYAERANLGPFSDEDIALMQEDCDALSREIDGAPFKKDYDWAALAIEKQHPTLLDLEEATGLDHWRPRFRWASQHTHAGYRPAEKLLGMIEATEALLLVGQSNSGFVDPLHMTAISLNIVNAAFLLSHSTPDHILVVNLIQALSDELGETAIRVERESFEKAKRNHSWRNHLPWFRRSKVESEAD